MVLSDRDVFVVLEGWEECGLEEPALTVGQCLDGCTDIDALRFPNARFSLTHSADLALAVAEPSGSLAGLGVDLEDEVRIKCWI